MNPHNAQENRDTSRRDDADSFACHFRAIGENYRRRTSQTVVERKPAAVVRELTAEELAAKRLADVNKTLRDWPKDWKPTRGTQGSFEDSSQEIRATINHLI